MKHVVYILFVFLTATVCGQSQRLPLRFRADGTFKIVQFSALHYIHNNPHARRALIRIREVVKAEQPDLVAKYTKTTSSRRFSITAPKA